MVAKKPTSSTRGRQRAPKPRPEAPPYVWGAGTGVGAAPSAPLPLPTPYRFLKRSIFVMVLGMAYHLSVLDHDTDKLAYVLLGVSAAFALYDHWRPLRPAQTAEEGP